MWNFFKSDNYDPVNYNMFCIYKRRIAAVEVGQLYRK